MPAAPKLYSVCMVDPMSEEVKEHLGYFTEKFARNFVKKWIATSTKHPSETRVVQATLAKVVVEQTNVPLKAKRKKKGT